MRRCLLHWLKCFDCFCCDKALICVFACIWCRFEAGPGRCTGGAGPHIQPGDWLGLAQCQRHACHRRPGHMKTNTLHPALLLSHRPIHLSHFPLPLSFLPPLSPSTPSQRCGEKEGCRRKRRGEHTVLAPHRLSLSPQGERLTLSPPYRFSHTSFSHPPFSLPFLAVTLRTSICHCYIQDCLLHESKWVWGTNGGVEVGMRRSERRVEDDWLQEWERGCFIHPFLVMVQLVFLL